MPNPSLSRDKTPDPAILFEDPHLLVLDKPAGLLSQGEHKGDRNLVDWLRGYLGRHYVGLVHRLDRNTSGLMVVAKRSKAAARLTQALTEGQLCRHYRAWLIGTLRQTAVWEHWLVKDTRTNVVRLSHSASARSQKAVLTVQPVAHAIYQKTALTLAEFRLETGRSHQIRVQSAAEGYPLLGDPKYGGKQPIRFPRPALHSFRLLFPHPMTQKTMTFERDLPEDMKKIGLEKKT